MSDLVMWSISCVVMGACLGFIIGYAKGTHDERPVPHDCGGGRNEKVRQSVAVLKVDRLHT